MPSDPKTTSTVLRAKLTSVQKEIVNINLAGREALRDPTRIPLFKSMFGTLDKYFEKHELLVDELIEHSIVNAATVAAFPSEDDDKRIQDVKRYYHESRMSHGKIEESNRPPPPPPAQLILDPNLTIQGMMSGVVGGRSPGHLPKISLPKFEGNLTEWPRFRDTFISLVHSDQNNLTDMERFHYLTTSVSGTAASVISHLRLEEANYNLAWQAIMDAFDNKRMLASAYLNQIITFKAPQNKPNVDSLKRFSAVISDSIAAFKLLEIPDQAAYILFYLAERCLDPLTREQFEIHSKEIVFPTFDDLNKFVRERCLAMQLAENNFSIPTDNLKSNPNSKDQSKNNRSSSDTQYKGIKTTLLANGSPPRYSLPECSVCHDGKHPIVSCKLFQSTPRAQRTNLLENWTGCTNCLNHSHILDKCHSKFTCRFCQERHHSDLHVFPEDSKTPADPASTLLTCVSSTVPADSNENEKIVILGTAIVEILDARGIFIPIRVVVDSCSHYSYITQRAMNKLGLMHEPCTRKISCMGGSIFEGVKGRARCVLRPKNRQSPNLKADVLVVNKIVPFLPNSQLPHKLIRAFDGYKLADPQFWKPSPIDLLLGADLFATILTGPVLEINEQLPKLFESIFGYIIIGQASVTHSNPSTGITMLAIDGDENHDLSQQLEKFWQIEEPKPIRKTGNPEHEECERHFQKTVRRMDDGRYVVSLPFKNNERPNLGNCSTMAMKRLQGQERKLQKDADLKHQYGTFMDEYVSLGHMYETEDESKYIIPHHSVTKEDRNKIKLRVVFDASAKTDYGALNDYLIVGPKLQNDIFDILLNFRAHVIVFVADITKFYRGIMLAHADRSYQHIYWRKNMSDAVKKFELATLTYGLSSSPFLALRVITQLLEDHGCDYPEAAKVLSRDIFVDDIATGAASTEEALNLQQQIISVLAKGQFTLSKWASNDPRLLEPVTESSTTEPVTISDEETPTLKILGLQWDPTNDCFLYKIKIPETKPTKRGVLSSIARVFDPLGFLSPVIFTLKVLMQDLWKQCPPLGWDDQISAELMETWTSIISELGCLSKLQIPRCVFNSKSSQYQVIGFADASSNGYCAVLYIRTITGNCIKVHLLAAKSKVAPVKQTTIPRLELCAAVLLSRLYNSMSSFMELCPNRPTKTYFFIDASIVLGWLNTPTYQLKTYVANRIELIHELAPGISWNHIHSGENPSDVGTRGLKPSQIVDNSFWWEGPEFLRLPEEMWPQSNFEPVEKLPDLKNNPVALASTTKHQDIPIFIKWMSRFSTWYQLLRVVAVLLRSIYNYRNKNQPKTGNVAPSDINGALITCVKAIQSHYFFHGNPDDTKDFIRSYRNLLPFRDEEGVWRVGGRLRKSNLPFDHKHAILLPYDAHFTNILVDYYHRSYAHAGPTFLQSIIQKRFWVTGLRRLVRKRYSRCLVCFRDRADSVIPVMADLPTFRLQGKRCFQFTGTDFAGPFIMRESLRRKAQVSKVYMCLFVCMETKALHIEAVTSLSTEAFFAAFDRFCSRRGLPVEMFSDCGKNFVGAANKLKELTQWFRSAEQKIIQYSTEKGIKWNFNPPYGAHHGGLWEAGVRSVKTLMRKTVGETPLTYEELSTAFAKFESILNSRPLCPISNDPEELDFLTPGHFLVGGHLLAHQEHSLLDIQENRLDRWQLVRRIHQQFWARWRLEYLNTLQKRNKWTESTPNLKEGDLVLLKDPSAPSLRWPLARVSKVHPGDDGVVRVVTVQTAGSAFTRPVTQVVPLLPLNEKKEDEA